MNSELIGSRISVPACLAYRFDGKKFEEERLRQWKSYPDYVRTAIENINSEFKYILDGPHVGKILRITDAEEELAGSRLRAVVKRTSFITLDEAAGIYANRLIAVGKGDKRKFLNPVRDFWHHSKTRAEIADTVFIPDATAPFGYFNEHMGYLYEESEEGSWRLLREHIWVNIAREDPIQFKWIMNWMAQLVQFPRRLPEVAMAIRGEQRTGKGAFFSIVGQLVQPYYGQSTGIASIADVYNIAVKCKMMYFLDEVDGAVPVRMMSKMKRYISERQIEIREMYRDVKSYSNYTRFGLASNDEVFLNLARDDARFAVFHISNRNKKDEPFFRALFDELHDNECSGFKRLRYDLKRLDGVQDFYAANFPITQIRADQVIASANSFEQFLVYLYREPEVLNVIYMVAKNHGRQWAEDEIYVPIPELKQWYKEWYYDNLGVMRETRKTLSMDIGKRLEIMGIIKGKGEPVRRGNTVEKAYIFPDYETFGKKLAKYLEVDIEHLLS